MKLLTDLLYKAYKSDLIFSYQPTASGCLRIYQIEGDEHTEITEGYIKEVRINHSPETTLIRMHEEVDEYLAKDMHDNEVEFEPEEARARLTEYERKHKEAGVKPEDFL